MMEDFTQQDDRQLRAALHNVALPVGLHERIRERLRTESVVSTELFKASLAEPSAELSAEAEAMPAPAPIEVRAYRRQLIGLALVASLVGLLFGWANWNSPLSPEQLARFTLEQLDEIRDEDTAWHTELPAHLSDLEATLARRVVPFVALRFQTRPTRLSEQCLLWEMRARTTQKRFYVLEFQGARVSSALSQQLQAINSVSGGMRLFAMRSGQQILVVAFEGRAEDYLHMLPAA